MAVHVDYKKPYGYASFVDEETGEKYKIHICKANCLFAWMDFYKDQDGRAMARLYSFFSDIDHLRRFLKERNFIPTPKSFTFHSKELDKKRWDAIKLLSKSGYKITIK